MTSEDSNMAANAICHAAHMTQIAWQSAAAMAEEAATLNKRPFVLLKPKIFPDGNFWCALYGEDLQSGVAGFGETPEKAAVDFDLQWLNAKAGPKP